MTRITRLGPDEWERARDIRLRALGDAPDAFWTTLDEERATSPHEWRRRLGQAESVTFVVAADGVDVGLAVGAPHHDQAREAGLYGLWVAPEARGEGVAETLVRAVITWARSAGFRALRLDVGDANAAAVRLYQRLGFEPTGRVLTAPPPRDHITEHERMLEL
jgi:ribosomal protein S18 acetylase RimI-like enzyme